MQEGHQLLTASPSISTHSPSLSLFLRQPAACRLRTRVSPFSPRRPPDSRQPPHASTPSLDNAYSPIHGIQFAPASSKLEPCTRCSHSRAPCGAVQFSWATGIANAVLLVRTTKSPRLHFILLPETETDANIAGASILRDGTMPYIRYHSWRASLEPGTEHFESMGMSGGE
jgi:hypothetical protein